MKDLQNTMNEALIEAFIIGYTKCHDLHAPMALGGAEILKAIEYFTTNYLQKGEKKND